MMWGVSRDRVLSGLDDSEKVRFQAIVVAVPECTDNGSYLNVIESKYGVSGRDGQYR